MFFGTSEEAKNYSCRVSIENKFGNEFKYSGPVHTLDKTEEAIIKSGLLLLIGATAARRSLDQYKNLKIDVTIQNLKNDAISKESQVFYQKDSVLLGDIYVDSDKYRGSDSE